MANSFSLTNTTTSDRETKATKKSRLSSIRAAIFIDGNNLCCAIKDLRLEIDYKKLFTILKKDAQTCQVYYYIDVLKVRFNRILPAQGDRLVKDALEQLEQMIYAGQLSGGSRLLIDGTQSVPVAYVIAHKLAHLYETIAVLDPKIGKKGYKTYIVTAAHGSSKYRVGDLIETAESQTERSAIKVVLCGPPQSGKSCLREGLKKAILQHLGAPYPYIITACPDGEGAHFQQTYEKDERSAEQIKSANKAEITLEFALAAAEWVRSADRPINIIDVGGKISDENKLIMQEATHAVILSGDPYRFEEWKNFCRAIDLEVVAILHSHLEAEKDRFFLPSDWREKANKLLESPLLTGSIHRLRRGKDLSTRPTIQALAELLIYLAEKNAGV